MSEDDQSRVREPIGTPTLLLLGGLGLSLAIQVGLGTMDPIAVALVLVGAGLLVRAVSLPARHRPVVAEVSQLVRWARVALLINVVMLGPRLLRVVVDATGQVAVGVTALLLAMLLVVFGWDTLEARPRLFGGRSATLLLLVSTVLGLLWLQVTVTGVDVFSFQQVGSERLLSGVSPYAPGYPDVYPPELSRRFYGPGLSVDGRLQFGLPYPPLSLLLAVPGYLLGDLRIMHLAAILVSSWLLLHLVPESPASRVAGVVFLTSPNVYLMIRHGWTEPFLVLGLIAVFSAIVRGSRVRDLLLGLTVAVKQYAILLAVVVVVLAGSDHDWRGQVRVLVRAVTVATAVTLPFLLWDPSGFINSVLLLQLEQPFRSDALSLLTVLVNATGWPPEGWRALPTLLGAGVAMAYVFRYAPRTLWGGAASAGLVMLGFLLLSKQAFANYYFVAVSASYLSVALTTHAPSQARAWPTTA